MEIKISTLSVLCWQFLLELFWDAISDLFQSFVKISIGRNSSFAPINKIHYTTIFLSSLLCMSVPCHQELIFSPLLWKILLSCSCAVHEFLVSWHWAALASAAEATGTEAQAETLSRFWVSMLLLPWLEAEWQVGQEPGGEGGRKHGLKLESCGWKTKSTK